jgi:hypothetical protein
MAINSCDSIRVDRELDSNEIDESDLQNKKRGDPRMSIFRGISIDMRDEYHNASDSSRFRNEVD